MQDFPVVDSEEEAEEVTGSQETWVGGVLSISNGYSFIPSFY